MLANASDGLTGQVPTPSVAQVGGIGPDGNNHQLAVDAGGNLLVTLAGGATAANQTTAIGKLAAVVAALSGSLTVATEAAVAARAGNAYRATVAPVPLVAAATGPLPAAPVPVALFGNPAGSTKTVTLDNLRLFANVAGVFTITRDPSVTATGSVPVTPVNRLAGSSNTPQATLYQGGGTTAIAATGGKGEETVTIGATATYSEAVAGCEILPPGHSLLVLFQPYTLLAYLITAGAGFDWREM